MDGPEGARWKRLEALWETVQSLPANERQQLFDSLEQEDPLLRGELEELFAGSSSARAFFTRFASVVDAGAVEVLSQSQFEELQTALADRYELAHEIGRGGMATVYLARDIRHGRDVALKVLKPELAATIGVDRFLREIEIAARLRHPHILPVYDSGEVGTFLYYVMPYEPGHSLRHRLAREGALPIDDAVRILHDVVDALAHAHEHGIVHRDIKPGNVLLSSRHATVADFGIAKAVLEATLDSASTAAEISPGTPRYMAPEQATGTEPVDHRADIYSVGLLAWEMLAGRPPFIGDTSEAAHIAHAAEQLEPLTAHRPDVPPALAGLVMKCLAKKPGDRWQRVEELLAPLDAMRAHSSDARSDGHESNDAVSARRRGVKRWAVLGAAMVILASLIWALQRLPGSGRAGSGLSTQLTNDPEAWELYRRANDNMVFRTDSASRLASARLQQAIDIDPDFAAARAALAQLYIRIPPPEDPDMRIGTRLQHAEQFALEALKLDPLLAAAHGVRGEILLRQYRFEEAEREFRRAIDLDPNEWLAREGLVRLFVFTEQKTKALNEAASAVGFDRLSPTLHAEHARAWLVNDRCDLARQALEPIADLDPPVGRARRVAAQCYALEQNWPDAVRQFENPGSWEGRAWLGYLYARSDRPDSAQALLEEVRRNQAAGGGAFAVAIVYTGLRDYDAAFEWLDRAVDDYSLRWEIMEPLFDDLHADPRFDWLRERIGLRNR